MRLKLLLAILALTSFFSAKPSSALAQEFAFDFDVLYRVAESGVTHIKQDITITNLVTNYYAQNYTLTISSEKIDEVQAESTQGRLSTHVNQSDGQTVITVSFPQATVGIGQQVTFTLNYNSRDIVSRKGRIWEIIIPGIEETQSTRSYITRLIVPESFGKPAYFSPTPRTDGTWTLSELAGRGISAAYGDIQVFTFNLIYYLENSRDRDEIQDITLPPDTAFQKVILTHLSETPQNVTLDQDGNWLASFDIPTATSKKIIAEGSILAYLEPDPKFKTILSGETQALYTQSQTFWEVTPKMARLAETLNDPRSIYDYVVSTLVYDYNRIEPGIKRLGASVAFERPDQAVCMEFSDLFIALARAKGIPAREVHGFAYTTNSRLQPLSLVTDVLHAWVEYYDSARQLWLPIDPTWGHTTRGIDYFTQLDFNHIAFAILGVKSDYPFPAGSFRRDVAEKNVYVEFSSELPPIPSPRIEMTVEVPKYIFSGKKIEGRLRFRNLGQVLYRPTGLTIQGEVPIEYQAPDFIAIPPYGHVDINFTLSPPPQLLPRNYQLHTGYDGETSVKDISTLPFLLNPAILFSIVAIGGLFVLITYAKRRIKGKS